jgi:2-polyprenyl-3-methyl-5-hydroxy-6-metoxy-1,4-benzoquinol methylase
MFYLIRTRSDRQIICSIDLGIKVHSVRLRSTLLDREQKSTILSMMNSPGHYCNICSKDIASKVETASVRPNVRQFHNERFEVWRCPHCLSIHASNEVDLERYYRFYPFHNLRQLTVDWMLRAMYGKLVSRFKRNGLAVHHTILDYGCGSGALVEYLRSAGYPRAVGYDQYSEAYNDPNALERGYDWVISQDVLEHLVDPWEHFRVLQTLTRPGSSVAIGTPNAVSIDLGRSDQFIHTLHQPYHRHIFSRDALLEAGEKTGWKVVRYYPTMYTNTWIPFVNQRFLLHYFRCCDDNIDLALEPIHANNWRLWTPLTLFYALFGSVSAPETDGMAVFRVF